MPVQQRHSDIVDPLCTCESAKPAGAGTGPGCAGPAIMSICRSSQRRPLVIVLMIVSFDRRDIAHPVMPPVVDERAPSMPGATANGRPLTQAKASIGSKSRTAA